MTSKIGTQASYVRSTKSLKLTTTQQMSTKLYGRDLKEYEDVDIDSLLAKLTVDELDELNNDIDPDNSLLPPAQRCRDQTTKVPTGPFRREKLLKYLEDRAKSEQDWDEPVPYQAGVKRGQVFAQKANEMPIELDIDDEYADSLNLAHENDLVDLAAILEMHSAINQTQYYSALKGIPQTEDQSLFNPINKPPVFKLLPDEPPNDTDVEECIEKLKKNDPSLKEININNMKHISKERIIALVDAAKTNQHLEHLTMANTATSDAELRGLVDVVENCKSLTNLNIESNFVSGDLLAQIMRATLKNENLIEFHAENQRSAVLGNQVEMDIARSIEENDYILRVGISFQCMEARNRVAEALERNYERLRLKRIGADY